MNTKSPFQPKTQVTHYNLTPMAHLGPGLSTLCWPRVHVSADLGE